MVAESGWRSSVLHTPGVDLAVYEIGAGAAVVFLHGGPGLDTTLMRPLAEALSMEFRCILYDQRGSGGTRATGPVEGRFHIDRFLDDLEAVRGHVGTDALSIVGWSWGAALAVLYGSAHPDRLERVALVSPGPIPFELLAVYHANLLRPLSTAERRKHADLTRRAQEALGAGDDRGLAAVQEEITRLTFRAHFYDPDLGTEHVEAYLESSGDLASMARLSNELFGSFGEFRYWDRLGQWKAPTLVMYGYQDFEPITQAYLIKEWTKHAQLMFINECGHWPWLEQPDTFFPALAKFLAEAQ